MYFSFVFMMIAYISTNGAVYAFKNKKTTFVKCR